MSAFQNILTLLILIGLFIVIYCRVTNKTLTDIFWEIKEIFTEREVVTK